MNNKAFFKRPERLIENYLKKAGAYLKLSFYRRENENMLCFNKKK